MDIILHVYLFKFTGKKFSSNVFFCDLNQLEPQIYYSFFSFKKKKKTKLYIL